MYEFDSEVHSLNLGDSFKGKPSTNYHCFRYDFKPASLDRSRNAKVTINETKEVQVNIPNVEGSSQAEALFKGNQKPCTKDAMLIYNKRTGKFRLERLQSMIQVKQTRFDNSSKRRGPTSSLAAGSKNVADALAANVSASVGASDEDDELSSSLNQPSTLLHSAPAPGSGPTLGTLSVGPHHMTAGIKSAAQTARSASPANMLSTYPNPGPSQPPSTQSVGPPMARHASSSHSLIASTQASVAQQQASSSDNSESSSSESNSSGDEDSDMDEVPELSDRVWSTVAAKPTAKLVEPKAIALIAAPAAPASHATLGSLSRQSPALTKPLPSARSDDSFARSTYSSVLTNDLRLSSSSDSD